MTATDEAMKRKTVEIKKYLLQTKNKTTMKSEFLKWRFWVLVAQVVVCALLLFSEPCEELGFKKMMLCLVLTKAAAVLLAVAIFVESEKWKGHFGFLSIIFEDDDNEEEDK